MATAATLSLADAQKTLERWQTKGPSDEEQIKFAEAASKELTDEEQVKKFEENVQQVGVWAIEIDKAFDSVKRGFEEMVRKYGKDFPELSGYSGQWAAFKTRWVKHLWLSRDVASEHIAILRRFDKVFLDMVQNIKTDADRLEVIEELKQFIDEKHDRSVEMSQGFLDLKRDIEGFVKRFDQYIIDKGVELEELAKKLKREIDGLQAEIEGLDKKIKDAEIALAVTGGLLSILGLIVSGSVLAAFQAERRKKQGELDDKKKALEDVNRKQKALAQLKSDFDGLKPDIVLICEKLVLFGEIWSSVRSQSVQFRAHIEGGMQALGNLRFKREVQLARDVCLPLMRGLSRYATEIEHSGIPKPS